MGSSIRDNRNIQSRKSYLRDEILMINLYVDDERTPPNNETYNWVVVRNYIDAIKILEEEEGNIGILSLDHDLGNIGATGYDIALWIEAKVNKEDYKIPKRFRCHSMNPVGKQNIHACYRAILKKVRG